MDPRLHGSDRKGEYLGDLGLTQPLEIAKDDHGALSRIHGAQGGGDIERIVGSAELIAWSVGVTKRSIRPVSVVGISW